MKFFFNSTVFSRQYFLFSDKFKGKVVWITGASSGVGEGLAYVLASTGAKLVLSGTNQERLDKVKQQCLSKWELPNL